MSRQIPGRSRLIAVAVVSALIGGIAAFAVTFGGSSAPRTPSASSLQPGASLAPGRTGPGGGGGRSPASASGAPVPHADPFSASIASYLAGRAGTVTAAVYDVGTGQTWTLGAGQPQATASIVKVDILETLLAGQPAGLTQADQALARQMIEDSDNDAATSLWYAAGGAEGLAAYDSKAGLTRTTPSSCVQCAGFTWPGWGLTTTVPYDQITLLRRLIEPGTLLTPADRRYALSLMESVTPDQGWGISGGVPAGVTVALKDGWLPLNDADTDWQVNSVGQVSGGGRDYLIAVLSTGNPTERYGIGTISRLAASIWAAMR